MAPDEFLDELFESMTPSGRQESAGQQLREAVLSRTTRTVRNRRRLRRGGLAAALVACYLGGGATISFWPEERWAEGLGRGLTVASDQHVDEDTRPNGSRLVRPEDDQVADSSPAAARLTPYERLCREGDQQLERDDDIGRAARSYKKALQLASTEQRSIAPDRDTWLLMALKQSTN